MVDLEEGWRGVEVGETGAEVVDEGLEGFAILLVSRVRV